MVDEVTDGFFREDEWGAEYRFVSEIVHSQSPLTPDLDGEAAVSRLRDLHVRIIRLLTEHWVIVSEERAYACIMQAVGTKEVHVARMQRSEVGWTVDRTPDEADAHE